VSDVIAASASIIARGSKSFAAAARLFDRTTRGHAIMLYAWCRHCDDEIDGQELGHGQRSPQPSEQRARLERLELETGAAMRGDAVSGTPFVAFQRVFLECDIPRNYPLDLLEGFAMDVEGGECRTLNDTLRYCYHVAGTVGGMMAAVMGVRDPDVVARAVDLGIAFQLTNIARDVMQDAADGRCYLPRQWLAEVGVPNDTGQFPHHRDAVHGQAVRLLDEAERYYQSARHGISRLSFRNAWAIASALAIYRDIGRVVRRGGAGAWQRRATVSAGRKLLLLGKGAAVAGLEVTFGRRRAAPLRRGLWSAS
jgi:phytoene synthase